MGILQQLIPEDRTQRIKLIAAVTALTICVIWLAIFMLSNKGYSGGQARGPTSEARKLASDLSNQLLSDPDFLDVGFAVESERPVKLKVVGIVKNADVLQRLKAKVEELHPQGELEWGVELPPR